MIVNDVLFYVVGDGWCSEHLEFPVDLKCFLRCLKHCRCEHPRCYCGRREEFGEEIEEEEEF